MLRLDVGFACNNACVFCAQGELRSTGASFDVAAAVAGVDAGETVVFQGGEPTLAPDLPKWIMAAVARGAARVIVQTNGRRLAYPDYTRELSHAGGGRLVLDVSLHGSEPTMHDWHTGVEGSFQQTLRGVTHARAAGVPFVVSVVVTRCNMRHVVEIVRVAHHVGARALRFTPVEPLGRAASPRAPLTPPGAMLEPRLRAALREASRLGLAMSVGGARDADPASPFAGLGTVEPRSAERT